MALGTFCIYLSIICKKYLISGGWLADDTFFFLVICFLKNFLQQTGNTLVVGKYFSERDHKKFLFNSTQLIFTEHLLHIRVCARQEGLNIAPVPSSMQKRFRQKNVGQGFRIMEMTKQVSQGRSMENQNRSCSPGHQEWTRPEAM